MIHGQVVEGWVPYLETRKIVVVSDEAAADETQRMLMELAVPEGVSLEILTIEGAKKQMEAFNGDDRGVMVLTPSPHEALTLLNAGLKIPSVNVGGLHHSVGRMRIGKAIFLTEEDRAALKAISAKGVALDARGVPGEDGIPLAEMLDD